MPTDKQQLVRLMEQAVVSSRSFEARFCMSCGRADHEGPCEGPPGPPNPPTHCPYCGTQRGPNQMCCETQDALGQAWVALNQLENWAKNHALSLTELAIKHGVEIGLIAESKAGQEKET